MAYKFITIPMCDQEAAELELNAFLRSHRVLSVERKWIDMGLNSCWTFCVDYLEPVGNRGPERSAGGRGRVDYREVLSPADFAVFAKLRQWRKDAAKDEAVPVYTVFTNEQLAQMVQNRVTSRADLETVAGVGDARIDKYGPRVLEILKQAWEGADAPDGKPV